MDKEKIVKPQEGTEPQITPEQERLFEQVVHVPSGERDIEQLHSGQAPAVPFEIPNSHSANETHHDVAELSKGKALSPKESVAALNKLISGGGSMEAADLVDSLAQIKDQTKSPDDNRDQLDQMDEAA